MDLIQGYAIAWYYKYGIITGYCACYLIPAGIINIIGGRISIPRNCPYHHKSLCLNDVTNYRDYIEPDPRVMNLFLPVCKGIPVTAFPVRDPADSQLP